MIVLKADSLLAFLLTCGAKASWSSCNHIVFLLISNKRESETEMTVRGGEEGYPGQGVLGDVGG